jgi:hypothetical protein
VLGVLRGFKAAQAPFEAIEAPEHHGRQGTYEEDEHEQERNAAHDLVRHQGTDGFSRMTGKGRIVCQDFGHGLLLLLAPAAPVIEEEGECVKRSSLDPR